MHDNNKKKKKLKISPLMTPFCNFALKIETSWANKVIKGPVPLPRIAGNAGNHEKDRRFHKSYQILNQTKWNIQIMKQCE